VATFYAVMIKTDYMQKETFNRNFWEGFKAVLGKGHVIKVSNGSASTSAPCMGVIHAVISGSMPVSKELPSCLQLCAHRSTKCSAILLIALFSAGRGQ
jgi:Eukaryotic DNA topoisomerase I, DNA binding fragment